jgi:hypothetical protein
MTARAGSRLRHALCGAAALALSVGCGGLGGEPPDQPPVVKGPDGTEYRLVVRGAYRAYYDSAGRLQRIDYDQDGDGRPDHIAHHDGARTPRLIEVDEDRDAHVDRWEEYGSDGVLARVGSTSRPGGGPDLWTVPGPGGVPARREYDEDGDGRPERVEILTDGAVSRVELDLDRDGRVDRWQTWTAGVLVAEEADTDADGRPDLRVRRGPGGAVEGAERLER